MDSLPTEVVETILFLIKDFHELLKLRLVSSQWNDMIEGRLRRQKSLAIVKTDDAILDEHRSTVNDRLFGALENERFLLIELRNFTSVFGIHFTFVISKLFSNVEHFAFRAPLNSDAAVMCLSLMLCSWTKITTLSLFVCTIPEHVIATLALTINRLEKLQRLDLGLPVKLDAIEPTLARIHRLALGFRMTDADYYSLIQLLGSHCTHLWISPEVLQRIDFTRWPIGNPNFCRRLTHFGCSSLLPKTMLQAIDTHFTSLTTWYTAGEHWAGYIFFSRLSRIREIRVLHPRDSFPQIILKDDICECTPPMPSVQTFEWRQACLSSLSTPTVNQVRTFLRRLDFLFPQARNIKLGFQHRSTVEMVERYLPESGIANKCRLTTTTLFEWVPT